MRIEFERCDCKDVIVLVEPTKAFQAYEKFCKIHGYQTNCYRCRPSVVSTELCMAHSKVQITTCENCDRLDSVLASHITKIT
jgi:hypothetical protein